MSLISFFNKDIFSSSKIQIGTTYEAFSATNSPNQPLDKHILTTGEAYFSCFLKGAEFIFVENKLFSAKFSDIPHFFGEKKRDVKNITLDKTIEIFTNHNVSWEIFNKYTKGQLIVLLANGVMYEYEVKSDKFRLELIRVQE